jgi:hypothetical protein
LETAPNVDARFVSGDCAGGIITWWNRPDIVRGFELPTKRFQGCLLHRITDDGSIVESNEGVRRGKDISCFWTDFSQVDEM